MIVAGLGILVWVIWQMFGTNVVSHRAQRRITHQAEIDWAAGRSSEASAVIRIPRFGKKYAVPVLEGTSKDVLSKGFGHFKKTADPGEVGNYALAGHRVTHGEPLRNMPKLRPGDLVMVDISDTTYTYELDTDPNKLTVDFTAGWVLAPLPKNPHAGGVQPEQRRGQRLITLTTCSELFHTDDRTIAFGHLVKKAPRLG